MTDQILETDLTTTDEQPGSTDQVEVRRNVVLSAVVGAVAAALTVAFALRAFGDGGPLDWALFAVLGVIAVVHTAAVVDARAPLLVADRLGVRLREGAEWQGIAWEQIECMEHLPRRLPVRDGHLLVVGDSGQQLIVPLTLATRVVGAEPATISDELASLADGRADVVEVVPDLDEDETTESDEHAETEEYGESAEVDHVVVGPQLVNALAPDAREMMEQTGDIEATAPVERRGIAAEVEKRFRFPLARWSVTDDTDTLDSIDPVPADDLADAATDDRADDSATDEIDAVSDEIDTVSDETRSPTPPPAPGRPVAGAARVEVQRPGFVRRGRDHHSGDTGSHPTIGANALRSEPIAQREEPDLSEQAEHTLTVVLDDLVVHPAAEPVVGPQLEAARERLRLTVDQLSERTRIRPHVIEAIEVDDFGPCGGDFYARGHLRTLARVLGIDAGPLVAAYDETYADAPVDPRRVFESELATGVGGSIRGTRGGRNWSVLVAAVMAAVLIWSIARLVMDGPVPIGEPSTLRQTGSGGIGGGPKAEAVPVTLTATGGGARVIVRDGDGDEIVKDTLAFGQTMKIEVVPPVRIWTSDGSVTAAVDCKDPMPLGETGSEASKSLPAC